MKPELSSLDLKYIVKELQLLVGGRVDKIHQINKKKFFFRFYVTNQGKKVLKIILPGLFYLTEGGIKAPGKPMGYCAFLRKYLNNARIRGIRQKGYERIIEIFFEKKEKYVLVIELFSRGNIILCKEDYTIISPLEGQDWSSRSIRKGLKYEFPPTREDISKILFENFKKIIEGSNKDSIVKTLAVDFGLGGIYAEEVCFGIVEKDKEVMAKEIKTLFDSFKSLLKKRLKPVVYNGKRAFPFKLKSFEGDIKEFDSYCLALDSLNFREYVDVKTKIDIMVEKQEKSVKKLAKEIEENTKIGELMYNKYQLIEDVLKQINLARKKYSWKEIKEKLKGHKIIKEINEKESKIVIEI
ncbi:NFACT family protein [Candidatus Woesearchaeota archaeon]|jgi:predicted ribosome quality control (RQC) complex YloA/Tae2 family protein|nr:NFACT family protein [Candidatus Woesearchaeota archaeon]